MVKAREPVYRVVKRDGMFEIRAYEPMTLAEVQLDNPSRKQALDEGFKVLHDYIGGANDKHMRLAMTIPVTHQPAGDRQNGISWIVRFIMPSSVLFHKLPKPKDERISLFRVPVGRAAIIRFPGRVDDAVLKEKTAELRNWIKAQQVSAAAPPTYALYNPPWVLPFLRRNEVMIGIEY